LYYAMWRQQIGESENGTLRIAAAGAMEMSRS
jgi:hypothetical protein